MVTWRTGVILLVVILSFAVVMPSVRAYSDQQATLGQLRAEAEAARAEVAGLEADVARWDDSAYIVAQARERLAYVFPGETPYRVVDAEVVTSHAEGSPAAERAPEADMGEAWFDELWASVIIAGNGSLPVADDVAVEDVLSHDEDDDADQLTDVDFGG